MRTAEIERKTNETDITVRLCLDGRGDYDIKSGSGFFDHMLEQFARHGSFDLYLRCKGDTQVDFHHSAEDCGIALGTAFLKALDKYPIDILTHLNYGFQIDTIAVAKMAKQKGVYVELNGKRINFTDDEILTMASEGVKFIVDSDAHRPERVGEVNNGLNTIYRLNIPLAQVANVDKLPKFNKKRGN